MQHRNTSRRSGALLLIASLLLAMVLGISCGNEQPADDLDYLVREVCRQVTVEGMTADPGERDPPRRLSARCGHETDRC